MLIKIMAVCLIQAGLPRAMPAQIPSRTTRIRSILHRNSYHPGYVWGDDIVVGVRSTIVDSGMPIELYTEYLDSRRYPSPRNLEAVAHYLETKYGGHNFDLVIVSDNAAFDFSLEHRDRLFPGAPLVFCGYNGFRSAEHPHLDNITGVSEEIDIPGGIGLATALQGDLEELIFIGSTHDLTFGRIYELFEKETAPELAAQGLPVRTLVDLPIEQILPLVANLGGKKAVFILGPLTSLSTGQPLSPEASSRLIAGACTVPSYSFLDLNISTGVLGGWVVRGRQQGETAARMALAILNGADPGELPVAMATPHVAIIDYKIMDRFGIPSRFIPKGAIIYNEPDTLLYRYGRYILAGIALILVQFLLIALLLRAVQGRKRAIALLEQERNALELRVQERTKDLAAANRNLRSREALFSGMFDRHIDIMLLIDPNSQIILRANQSAIQFYGYSKKEIEGSPMSRLIRGDSLRSQQVLLSQVSSLHRSYEASHLLADGTIKEVEVRSSRILLEDHEILYCVIQDRTEIHRINRLKEDMERIARHDLRSPLNAVIGLPQYILESHVNLPKDIVESLRVVIDSAQSMANLVKLADKLLQMEQGSYIVEKQPVDLIPLVRRILLEQRPLSEHKRSRVRFHGLDEPIATASFKVLGEELLCYSILSNLIKNALEATPSECPITLQFNRNSDQAQIRIHNWGAVPADIKGRFFDKYVTSGKPNGTGLGTYSARLLAQAMQGSLVLDSSVEEGTSLILLMPTPP